MKVLLTDYVASLKERGELDAILPDILSEIGFNIISRPGIGVAQRGVDIAAVGTDTKGVRKLYLLSVKAGDLTRTEWSVGVQSLRPSLEEIIDVYIPTQIPAQYKGLPVVICIVVGGGIQQTVQQQVTGFINKNTRRKRSFEIWNGGFIADLLLTGLLREKLLPKELQSSFQKAVAMVDQPDVSYEHYGRLLFALRDQIKTDRDRVRVARQIYLCLWILFVWGRDVDNLEAPYRASELAMLHVWELMKPLIGTRKAAASAIASVVFHLVQLHNAIAQLFLDKKIYPYVAKSHALSIAVSSGERTDINLKMFDILGKLALTGHWLAWASQLEGKPLSPGQLAILRKPVVSGIQLIWANPSLLLPITDDQSIEIALFLSLAAQLGLVDTNLSSWLSEMVKRLQLSVNTHGRYPTVHRDYADLIEHPKEATDEYRKEATSASVLIPLLLAWVAALNDSGSVARLMALMSGPLAHCTLQFWLPDAESEKHLYLNDDIHGVSLNELPLTNDGKDLLKVVANAAEQPNGLSSLSIAKLGYFPLILTASRHYRLPVPPQFWIPFLVPPDSQAATPEKEGTPQM